MSVGKSEEERDIPSERGRVRTVAADLARRTASMQLARFLTVGLLNTAVGLGLTWLLMALGSNTIAANAAGFAVGMTVSFTLNRKWTFAHRGDWRASLPRWLAVAAVAYVANLAVMLATSRGLGINPYYAQLLGTGTYTIVSYLGSKRFAFAAG